MKTSYIFPGLQEKALRFSNIFHSYWDLTSFVSLQWIPTWKCFLCSKISLHLGILKCCFPLGWWLQFTSLIIPRLFTCLVYWMTVLFSEYLALWFSISILIILHFHSKILGFFAKKLYRAYNTFWTWAYCSALLCMLLDST